MSNNRGKHFKYVYLRIMPSTRRHTNEAEWSLKYVLILFDLYFKKCIYLRISEINCVSIKRIADKTSDYFKAWNKIKCFSMLLACQVNVSVLNGIIG